VAPCLPLRKDQLLIENNVKDSISRRHQLDLRDRMGRLHKRLEPIYNRLRQTDGSRRVVSVHAENDSNVHPNILSDASAIETQDPTDHNDNQGDDRNYKRNRSVLVAG
jgi:hypothetical protein